MDPFAVVCHLFYHAYIHQLKYTHTPHTHTYTHTPHTTHAHMYTHTQTALWSCSELWQWIRWWRIWT